MWDMMGEEFLARRDGKRSDFTATVRNYSDEVCFGRVWAHPGVDCKERSILNIGMLVGLNRTPQPRTHIEGAISNGVTVEELREILLQTAVYCGLPAAVEGFRVAEEVPRAKNLLD